MPGVVVTLTYALPVCAEALAAQMMAHIEALPTINVLRLCNRFGHGRFSDLPVELVQTIEEYFVEQVHGRVTEELAVASRCFKNKCSILDHADRGRPLKMYATYATSSCRWMDFPDDPNDEQLVEALEEIHDDDCFVGQKLEWHEEEEAHQWNRSDWPQLIEGIFSKSNRRAFQRRFGLDLWYSFVSLPYDGSFPNAFGLAQATIAYLTLPGSVERCHQWSDNTIEERDEYPSHHGEHGFGMAVNISRQPSAEELSRFPLALKVLKLKVFIHSSQQQYSVLGLGPPYDHKKLGASNGSEPAGGSKESKSSAKSAGVDDSESTATSVEKDKASVRPFPRLMLLTRNID